MSKKKPPPLPTHWPSQKTLKKTLFCRTLKKVGQMWNIFVYGFDKVDR
jgi:hypothetical protein